MHRFLIIGQTGVGKSSFVNSVCGTQVANTDAFEARTKVVEHYICGTAFGDVCLIDTPGLSENSVDVDIAYLHLVRQAIMREPVDVTLYITRLDDTRFRLSERRALMLLTAHLGKDVWQKSWLVMTFAASIPENQLQEAVNARSKQITTFLREQTATLEGSSFKNFAKCLLVDNVVPNWRKDAMPISSELLSH